MLPLCPGSFAQGPSFSDAEAYSPSWLHHLLGFSLQVQNIMCRVNICPHEVSVSPPSVCRRLGSALRLSKLQGEDSAGTAEGLGFPGP